MNEQSIIEVGASRPGWETLEAYAREGIRRLLQQMLEEEVEEALGRQRYARRAGVDAAPGYRNGWGKPRRLSLMSGTITVRRPPGAGAGGTLRESAAAAVQAAHGGSGAAPARVVPARACPWRL